MEVKLPFLAKLVLVIIMLLGGGFFIMIGKDILVPIAFSFLLAILLLPVTNFLNKRGISDVLATGISVLLSLLIIAVLIYFVLREVSIFADDFEAIKKQMAAHLKTVQKWINTRFSLSYREQEKLINETTEDLKNAGTGVIGQTVFTLTGSVLTVSLLPFYTFLILYYRSMLKKFIIDVFDPKHKEKVLYVMGQSRSIVLSYMTGLLVELLIISIINSAGFMIIGIKYALFLAVLAAVLNMIPYIGMLIAGVFCMLVTLSTSSNISDTLWVAVVLMVVQFIDNNFITPFVVSAKVKINALMSIIGVLIGYALAGISGMFLSIPVLAILKAVFDQVDDLRPWGMLLGDDITAIKKEGNVLKKMKKLTKQKSNTTVDSIKQNQV